MRSWLWFALPFAMIIVACSHPHVSAALSPNPGTTGRSDDRFPPPEPDVWDAAPLPGLTFAACHLSSEETDRFLGSFLYGTLDAREIERRKTFSVDACYQTDFRTDNWHGPAALVIVAEDLHHPDGQFGYHLAAFFSGVKTFEINYGLNYYAHYEFAELPTSGEINPLVFVRRDEGADAREITYDLYRIERDGLRRLWEWSDSIVHSTTGYFSISRLDFSQLREQKRFTAYTTYGNSRQLDPTTDVTIRHRATRFAWNDVANAFVKVGEQGNSSP